MGLIYSHAALLAKAKRNGICFDTILTIGRQSLYLTKRECRLLGRSCGLKTNISALAHEQHADKFFQTVLDAQQILSLDYADYEGCDIVHDMNQPVDPSLHEKFDVVIDGGSLEHIFHFPVAIANCMKMVKKDGSIFIFTTANNFLGHGLYQFSPELFFRVFEPRNGFEIRDMILERHRFPGVELSTGTRMYAVRDPASLKERVGLVSRSPVLIIVHAVRKEVKPIFDDYPIQSDYESIYGGNVRSEDCFSKKLIGGVLQFVPLWCRRYIVGHYQLMRYSFMNRRFYKRRYPA